MLTDPEPPKRATKARWRKHGSASKLAETDQPQLVSSTPNSPSPPNDHSGTMALPVGITDDKLLPPDED
eukprot:2059321-Prorocentrum_lima.AAC.1